MTTMRVSDLNFWSFRGSDATNILLRRHSFVLCEQASHRECLYLDNEWFEISVVIVSIVLNFLRALISVEICARPIHDFMSAFITMPWIAMGTSTHWKLKLYHNTCCFTGASIPSHFCKCFALKKRGRHELLRNVVSHASNRYSINSRCGTITTFVDQWWHRVSSIFYRKLFPVIREGVACESVLSSKHA